MNAFMKQGCCFLLVCVMALTMVPTTSLAVNISDSNYCPHCGKIPEGGWTSITSLGETTDTGHYRLAASYVADDVKTIGKAADVVIDLAGNDITAKANTRLFAVYGGLSVLDSSTKKTGELIGSDVTGNAGNDRHGAVVYLSKNATSKYGYFNLYSGTVRGGKAKYGGNIYVVSGAVNIYGGTVKDGVAQTFGCNIGANTGSATLNVYGGTVSQEVATAPKTFGNITAYGGGTVNIYGGTISETRTGASSLHVAGASNMYVYGGNLTGTAAWATSTCTGEIKVYNGNISGQDPSAYLATCATCYPQGDAYAVCHGDDCSDNCNLAVAKVGTVSYTKLEDALRAATPGNTVTMTGNCKAGHLEVSEVTLDLAGYVLAADAVDASLGNIIDSTNGNGLLICPAVSFSGTNKHLPLKTTEGYRFTAVTLKQRNYGAKDGVITFKFYIDETADKTQLAKILENGTENTGLSIKLRLIWTRNGTENSGDFVIDSKDVAEYAKNWDTSMFVLTISGLEGVTSLTCAPVVASTPIEGLQTEIAVSGAYEQGIVAAKVNSPLTREEIEQFDDARENLIKNMGTMTEAARIAALRQHCVDYVEFTKHALWTPNSDRYFNLDSKTQDALNVGTVYGGLPYVSNATGSLYRLLDYIDENGVLDAEAATKNMRQFGTMCSSGVYAGWSRVITSAKKYYTADITPANGFLPLGWDPTLFDLGEQWTADCTTHTVVERYGVAEMAKFYAQLQPGDGCLYIDASGEDDAGGHVVMIKDVHVVYKSDNKTIDYTQSYVTLLEQTKPWVEGTKTGANGTDTYQYKELYPTLTFDRLKVRGYVPFTFAEFLPSSDLRHKDVEETTCSITKQDGTPLEPVVENKGGSLWNAEVSSNYGILDIYITVTDPNTNEELYWYAYRVPNIDTRKQAIPPYSDNVVTRGEIPTYTGTTQYPIKIEAQLSTGERPVLYEGLLQR